MSKDTKSDYLFFLSYSRRDAKGDKGNENPWFLKFSNDLAQDVATAIGIASAVPNRDIEFYDREGIPAGAAWDNTLAEALQSSKVLICLYSPSYFKSEYCGKEFQVFSERVTQYEAKLSEEAGRPQLIIPVLWENPAYLPDQLPEAVRGMQLADKSLGLEYAESGVLHLMRTEQWTLYYKFLQGLVTKIRAAALCDPGLSRLAGIDSLSKIRSAFHIPAALPAFGLAPEAKGIKIAWFVYVVGGESDYAKIRDVRNCYGSSGLEWRPYLPDDENIIGYLASTIATGKGLTPLPVTISNNLITQLQEAEDKNTAVVIIVDPWSVKLPSFQESMKLYDGTRLTNCGVVVLWNMKDDETAKERQNLEKLLKKTFSRNLISQDMSFQDEVCSVDDLRAKLGDAIEHVKNKIYQRGRLLCGEADTTADSFPKLPTANTAPAENQPVGGVK